MKKFISDDDKLKGEIDKMISVEDTELMKELFPEELKHEQEIAREDGKEIGKVEIARIMKELGDKPSVISKRTGLNLQQIEELY